ncbi:hypothetical protein [Agaribacterium haliotis]|uniref:hypothetical protein n=1 Tax=Agaribacterium haliotis TaxID=2013869 RepID=UPI000BB575F6|nr:hypothetical protein [Agaribacterium haliotis]
MPTSYAHRSPGLTAIYNAVKASKKNRILDLGPCIARHLSFYSQLGASFHFDDFGEQLTQGLQQGELDEQALRDAFVQVKNQKQAFDIVLCWDLFNFLPLDLTVALLESLKDKIKKNTLFHIVSYVGSSVPVAPCTYVIDDQYSLTIQLNSARDKPRHRLTTSQILKALPDFFMLRSFVNSEGMAGGFSEQILSFEPDRKVRTAEFASAEIGDAKTMLVRKLQSPALSGLRSASTGTARLLDLGRKTAINVDAWKQNYASVRAEDLRVVMRRASAMSKSERSEFLRDGHFLRFEQGLTFDVIVAWDLLNYLDDDLLFELGRRLVALSRNGTRLMLMANSSVELPVQPLPFILAGSAVGLSADVGEKDVRPYAALSSVKIQQALPGFFVERSYSSRPGMLKGVIEYVLVFKDEAQLAKERQDAFLKLQEQKRKAAEQLGADNRSA